MRRSAYCAVGVTVSALLAFTAPAWGDSDVEVWSYGGAFNLAIPAESGTTRGWMDVAIIEVPDHLVIEDLDVILSVTHPNVFDLQLSLTSPSGTTLLLSRFDPFDGFFEGADYQGTVFDDEAGIHIIDGAPPFEGAYRPLGDEGLAVFDGEDAFGQWRLEIYDAYYLDAGTLDSFVLTISAPEPATIAIVLAGLGLVRFSARRRS